MKPVLLGMNNPHSASPVHALYPTPIGATGHRIFEMLREAARRSNVKVTSIGYIEAFDRINLLNAVRGDPKEAKENVHNGLPLLKNRKVVVLGRKTAFAVGIKRPFNTHFFDHIDFKYCLIPHPSGLCREYNDPAVVRRIGDLLFDLYIESRNSNVSEDQE